MIGTNTSNVTESALYATGNSTVLGYFVPSDVVPHAIISESFFKFPSKYDTLLSAPSEVPSFIVFIFILNLYVPSFAITDKGCSSP